MREIIRTNVDEHYYDQTDQRYSGKITFYTRKKTKKKKLTGNHDDYHRVVQQGLPEVHDVFPVRCGFAKRKHDSLSYDCDYCANHRSVAGGGKGVFLHWSAAGWEYTRRRRGRLNCDNRRALDKKIVIKTVDNKKRR